MPKFLYICKQKGCSYRCTTQELRFKHEHHVWELMQFNEQTKKLVKVAKQKL